MLYQFIKMMKKIFLPILFVLPLAFFSCTKKPEITVITSLSISLSKVQIIGDGIDSASITVVNQDGLDVKRRVTIYFDNKVYDGKAFRYSSPIVSTIYAGFGSVKSNEIEVEVVEDKNLKYEKNILLEQYTGTWCGWCPRAIYQIENLQKTDKKVAHVALHLDDEMTYSLSIVLFQSFGFTGIPTVHADRSFTWEGDSSIISSMHAPVRAGFKISVSGDPTLITTRIKIKFGKKYTENLKMTVYLVHDNLVADQANYYNDDPESPYYQRGAVMSNFVHRNVLIKPGTDMFGEDIPADSIGIGGTYTREIRFTNFRCENINDIKVIAFITYTDLHYVLNCVFAGVGEQKDFVIVN